MTMDPVQLLIDAGALPSSPFGPNSRYYQVPVGSYPGGAGDAALPYLLRRFIPQRRDIALAAACLVQGGDRPDLLAARALGDPELYWRVADANLVSDPFELIDTIGRRLVLPTPPGA